MRLSPFSFSKKNIRHQLHGDAELSIARLYGHHARLALEGLVFEIQAKPDRLADRIGACVLKENSRGADVTLVPIPCFNCTGRLSL
jgi:hypothetical protein